MKKLFLCIALLPLTLWAQQKLSTLPSAPAQTGTEIIPEYRAGACGLGQICGVTPAQLASYTNSIAVYSGDCTGTSGVLLCTRTNGVLFAPSATVDTTNTNNITNFAQAAALGNIVILSSDPTWAADFQAADTALCNAGGGDIFLQPAVYTLPANTNLILDIGCGVGLQGHEAYLYAPNHTTATALSLNSAAPAGGPPIPGIDVNTNNYLQKRASATNFTLVGPCDGIGCGTSDGLDINQVTPVLTRSPRPTADHFAVYGFHKNIAFRNQGYLATLENFISTNGDYGIYFNGGINPAENQEISYGTVANNTIGIVFDTAAETGTAGTVDVTFNGLSLDYNAQQIKVITAANGHIRFNSGNFENNNAAQTYQMDFSGTLGNSLQVLFYGLPRINFTGGSPSTAFTNYFNVGSAARVRLEQPWFNNILGSGQTVGTLAYPALANVASGGHFEITGTSTLNTPTLAPLISLEATSCWLTDPGFEQTTLVDEIFIYKDTSTTQYQGARATGTNIASITTSTGKPNGGSRSLDITLGAQGTVTAGTRVFGILLPRRADRIFAQWAWATSGGSGTFIWSVNPVVVDWASNATNPIILSTGTAIKSGGPNTPGTSYTKQGWGGSTYTNDPRLLIPQGYNAVLVTFDLSLINNSGGHFYLDDFWPMGW